MTLLEARNKLALNACNTVRGIVVFHHKDGKIHQVDFKVEANNYIPPEWAQYSMLHGCILNTLASQVTFGYN